MVILGMELLGYQFYICWTLEDTTKQFSKVDASNCIPINNLYCSCSTFFPILGIFFFILTILVHVVDLILIF